MLIYLEPDERKNLKMKYKRICILDTETTDRYWNSCAPIQIAAVICDDKGNILDTFNERIKTTHKINPEASQVHGIFAKDLVNCRGEHDVLEDFCVWMKTNEVDVVLTYNGEAFDRRMLNKRCEILKINYDFFNKDKLGRKWRLSLVAEILGFDNDGAHDALEDVLMLKNIWFYLDPMVHPEDWGKPSVSLF